MKVKSEAPKRIAFAGGGSGGHLYPQIAVAKELLKIDPKLEIFFVSTRGSIEEKLIPKDGFEVLLIPSGKLKGQGPIQTAKTLLQLIFSVFVCVKILLSRRPDLIFSAGGYAGAPFLVLGSLMGVRCEILEQNRMPGLANRWMAKFCKKVYVNFEASAKLFSSKEVIAVGHPCREEIEKARWTEEEFSAKLSADLFRVFVFGGSQGAMGINRLVTAASKGWKDLNLEILHQTGELDFERVKKEYSDFGFEKVRVEKFIYKMAEAFRESHLVICRAGASSLAELAAAGKAALLIPLVSKDQHQEFNAKEIENLGAGITRLQGSLTPEDLAAIVKNLYTNRKQLADYSKKMALLHHPNAARTIASSILKG
jgi:UDP-N-acetylglucosamine--N-acetylmuramyl-(pentapeptide) pyrophosphoryl-undecaprenol N-acetylglucosamine transferase